MNLPIKRPTVEQARAMLKEALERSPDDIDAWIALSTAEIAIGNPDAALAAIQSAMRAAPKSEEVLAQVAYVAEVAGRLDLSIAAHKDDRAAYDAALTRIDGGALRILSPTLRAWAAWAAEPIDEELLCEVRVIFAPVQDVGHVEGLPENN
jgi:tetratricopeptide (TPR) repeat protein